MEQARKNAELNGLQNVASFVCEDVFELLPRLEKEGEKFDVVILDPPAFTKSRNSIKNAIKGYREINLRGMKLVKDGGYLCTCSCSHFMDYELFTKTINQAALSWSEELTRYIFIWCGFLSVSYCSKKCLPTSADVCFFPRRIRSITSASW